MATTKVGLFHDPRKPHPWVVRWFGEYDPASDKQRRYCRSFRLKREGERFRAEKHAELDKGAPRDLPDDITVGAFCGLYLERRKGEWRETTRLNYADLANRLLEQFGRDCLLRSIRPQDAHKFWIDAKPVRSDMEGKQLSKDTRNRILREAKTLFGFAVRWEYLPANPFAALKQQKVSKKDRKDWHYITPVEYRALLDVAPDQRWRCFYAVSYTAGLRLGESANLTTEQVDVQDESVLVRTRPASESLPSFDLKDHEDRRIPVPRTTLALLATLVKSAQPEAPFLLLTPARNRLVLEKWLQHRRTGKPWTNRCMVNNMLREFRRHAKQAGFRDSETLTLHSLRKSCAVNWANHLPIHVTQAYMGHADISTTQQFYLSVGEEHAKRASWIIERITSPGCQNKNDARVTPSLQNGHNRRVG